mmetsp:Transcript_21362/g.50844  ORF Transcript_21362/g.50844 Transcript_21362/m.50844 type:complete len:227 (-) Transcript_21362:35-715(-)
MPSSAATPSVNPRIFTETSRWPSPTSPKRPTRPTSPTPWAWAWAWAMARPRPEAVEEELRTTSPEAVEEVEEARCCKAGRTGGWVSRAGFRSKSLRTPGDDYDDYDDDDDNNNSKNNTGREDRAISSPDPPFPRTHTTRKRNATQGNATQRNGRRCTHTHTTTTTPTDRRKPPPLRALTTAHPTDPPSLPHFLRFLAAAETTDRAENLHINVPTLTMEHDGKKIKR